MKQRDENDKLYIREIAEDCPVLLAKIRAPKGGLRTVAVMQYQMITENPYRYTSDDVIFSIYAIKMTLAKRV